MLGKAFSDWLSNMRTESTIDWDEAMRYGNPWYDRIAAAFSKRTHKERAAAVAEYNKELDAMAAEGKNRTVFLIRLVAATGSTRGAIGQLVGHMCLITMAPASLR